MWYLPTQVNSPWVFPLGTITASIFSNIMLTRGVSSVKIFSPQSSTNTCLAIPKFYPFLQQQWNLLTTNSRLNNWSSFSLQPSQGNVFRSLFFHRKHEPTSSWLQQRVPSCCASRYGCFYYTADSHDFLFLREQTSFPMTRIS